MNWTVILLSICAVLVVFSIRKEYMRANRSRLTWRILASLLAVVALACIALPISFSTKTITDKKNGILLTTGFREDSLSEYRGSKIFTTQPNIVKAYSQLNITLIADLADLQKGKYNISSLHVLGHGLNDGELKQLSHFPIQFYGSDIKPGVSQINWKHQLKTGEQLHVQGKFNAGINKVTLILKGLNTNLDSCVITKNTNINFDLKTIPKNIGRSTYNLIALNGKDTIENEIIPFVVEPAKPVKVLILATSPDFETRFLKNWLSGQGYSLAVKTTITKDKFSREYFNMAQVDVDKLTLALLDKFDIVVGDLSTFKLLSGAENSALQQHIMQKGLGLIVKADSSIKGSSFLNNVFALDKIAGKDQKPLSLNINGQNAPSAKLILDGSIIKPQNDTQPLVTDEQNHIVAYSIIYGSGKIIFTTLSNTYNWALAGDKQDYSALWSLLIDRVSRKSPLLQHWSVKPQLPVVDEPVTITVDGPAALPMQIKANESNIAFRQNAILPFSWNATYWPITDGWQQITQNGTELYSWYAYANNAWTNLYAHEKLDATLKYTREKPVKDTNKDVLQTEIKVPVSKLYFYIVLLLCCSYLWLEQKL